jgi:hypothetical protein
MAGDSQQMTVGAERQIVHAPVVTSEDVTLVASRRIPQSYDPRRG